MLEKTRSEHTWIEPINLNDSGGETSSKQISARDEHLREERLQSREGKSCSRTVKQALAINHLKARKPGEHLPE